MADRQNPLSLIFDKAIKQHDDFFIESSTQGRKLTSEEISVYSSRAAITGWRTELHLSNVIYEIDIVVDRNFPFSAPRIALVDKSKFLSWPHVERDGCLCLLHAQASIKTSTSTELIQYLLKEAVNIATAGQAKTNYSDFVSEFHSYWSYVVDSRRPTVWSNLGQKSSNRFVVCWHGKNFTLVGEDEKQLQNWLRNYFHEKKDVSRTFQNALLLWLENPIFPEEYPKSNADFANLIKKENQETQDFFYKSLPFEEIDTLVLFRFGTDTGVATGGVWLKKPTDNILQRGFRNGSTNKKIMSLRYLSNRRNLSTVGVQRIDSEWIHTRGGKSEAKRLQDKTVALIGCGSIGSQVAQVLAHSGVGRFLLIDPDVLSWDNVARHALGGSYVGQNKAEAMANYLSVNFPHIEIVNAHKDQWGNCFQNDATEFSNCDIVVATTGDWQAESSLNYIHRTSVDFPPVIFGWTEAHACAGHAMIVHDLGGCLSCGMDSTGNFEFSVIDWQNKGTFEVIPACGGFYQPYGIIDLIPIVSMIADLVIKALLGKTCRSYISTWIGQENHYRDLGGTLTPYWADFFKNEQILKTEMIEQEWHINQDCNLCS